MKRLASISIDLSAIKTGLELFIDERTHNTLFEVMDSAENNEAQVQLIEGCSYDYTFSDEIFTFKEDTEQIIRPQIRNKHTGTISPNIFVGTLSLLIFLEDVDDPVGNIELEVQSIKTSYREDYRDMLEYITEKCTDLLLLANAPVSHYFETDFSKDSNPKALYQKFTFIRSIISSDEFFESVHRILISPVTQLKETSALKDIRQTRRFSNDNFKEFVKGSKRIKLPETHCLKKNGLNSLPERLNSSCKTDSVDTPENRFIKHALEVFLKFNTDINNVSEQGSKLFKESKALISILELQLQHSVFNEISRPITLKINSPVLQRKEGYREVLRVWLMFDLAAKLIWSGGDDVYSGGKKDIATLYEYWLFFKLLDLFKSIFNIEPSDISELLKETKDGLNLQIKQGQYTAMKGVYNTGTRKLNIRFNYNRSFSGKKSYPNSGSWTTTMRPDYTLSIWPFGITEFDAEHQELVVHIHFDAKYKIANLSDFISINSENGLDKEKIDNRKGVYKNADLLKMHAYKDAIRRTGGAYVLYPGDRSINQKGFHEILPGLGAFPVRPSKTDNGTAELRVFILEIIEHFINRSSQREKLAFRTYDIYKYAPKKNMEVREELPELYGGNRALIPDDTFVLIGYYNSKQQYDWIKRNKLYNFRMGSGGGSLLLDLETVTSKYLILHTYGDQCSGELWRIVSRGPRVYSKNDLIQKGYLDPSQDNYLVVQLEPVNDPEFKNVKWNFKKLNNYAEGRASAFPFTASLTELMMNKVK